jgi:hypothetical protein
MEATQSFATTDDLFAALRVPEVRGVLLQACADADVRSEALRALLQDRYGDLLASADEAAAMRASVRDLAALKEQIRRFLTPTGRVEHTCDGPCDPQ